MKLYLLFSLIMGNKLNLTATEIDHNQSFYDRFVLNAIGGNNSEIFLSITEKVFNSLDDKSLEELFKISPGETKKKKEEYIKNYLIFVEQIISKPNKTKNLVEELLFNMLLTITTIYKTESNSYSCLPVKDIRNFLTNISFLTSTNDYNSEKSEEAIKGITSFFINIIVKINNKINSEIEGESPEKIQNLSEMTFKRIFGNGKNTTKSEALSFVHIYNTEFFEIFFTPDTFNKFIDGDTSVLLNNIINNKFLLIDILKQLMYGLNAGKIQEEADILSKNIHKILNLEFENSLITTISKSFNLKNEEEANLIGNCILTYKYYKELMDLGHKETSKTLKNFLQEYTKTNHEDKFSHKVLAHILEIYNFSKKNNEFFNKNYSLERIGDEEIVIEYMTKYIKDSIEFHKKIKALKTNKFTFNNSRKDLMIKEENYGLEVIKAPFKATKTIIKESTKIAENVIRGSTNVVEKVIKGSTKIAGDVIRGSTKIAGDVIDGSTKIVTKVVEVPFEVIGNVIEELKGKKQDNKTFETKNEKLDNKLQNELKELKKEYKEIKKENKVLENKLDETEEKFNEKNEKLETKLDEIKEELQEEKEENKKLEIELVKEEFKNKKLENELKEEDKENKELEIELAEEELENKILENELQKEDRENKILETKLQEEKKENKNLKFKNKILETKLQEEIKIKKTPELLTNKSEDTKYDEINTLIKTRDNLTEEKEKLEKIKETLIENMKKKSQKNPQEHNVNISVPNSTIPVTVDINLKQEKQEKKENNSTNKEVKETTQEKKKEITGKHVVVGGTVLAALGTTGAFLHKSNDIEGIDGSLDNILSAAA